jgi:very-short-patch-repair endonuclease
MHNWDAIEAFYAQHHDQIMQSANEWGVTPYSWEVDAGVTFTPIESALWSDIRMEGAIFYPQYPVFGYFVDFANPVAKVAIECDGKEFHQDKAKDALRDANLAKNGWKVYRFTGSECMKDCREYYNDDGVLVVELAPVQKMLHELVKAHKLRIGLNRKPGPMRGAVCP